MTIAYHGDKTLKKRLLRELSAHARADSIVQRTYGEFDGNEWRGCAVACSLRSLHKINHTTNKDRVQYADHGELARLMGFPEVLMHLEDMIFEGLPLELARAWPRRFAASVRPGADLSMVWPRFAVAILSDPDRGAARHASPAGKAAIAAVVALLERRIAGDEPSADEWHAVGAAAARAAWAAVAAARAARAAEAEAARAAEAEAAWAAAAAAEAVAAAWAAAAVAAWAAVAAARAARAAAEAAEAAHYEWMADTLIALLEEA